MAEKWGTPISASICYRTALSAGERAETEAKKRTRAVMEDERPEPSKAGRKPPSFSLVVMLDGWMVRERGPDWGLKPPDKQGARVEWHEIKGAVLFRVEDQSRKASGRGTLVRKHTVSVRGSAEELGRRVYAEAVRRGLGEAETLYVVADGAVWIWNLVAEHFPRAEATLDFYHAAQHLDVLARALHKDPEQARQWSEPLRHQLLHDGEAGVLRTLQDLTGLIEELDAERKAEVRREVKYFKTHAGHLHYADIKRRGCPIGSGAMESRCARMQKRLKRGGQFWTIPGESALLALDDALNNGDWDSLWEPSLEPN